MFFFIFHEKLDTLLGGRACELVIASVLRRVVMHVVRVVGRTMQAH